MAIQCITVSLSNHEMSYCKMHRPPTHKEFGHYSHVFNGLHNKIKPFNICVHTLQLDYIYFLLF